VFGTNPFAYGIPAGRHAPVVLDVTTTVTSMQKVRVAAQRGSSMPDGVILDRSGNPTTDPREFFSGGLMAPLGHPQAPHKGFGLALVVETLSGVPSGAAYAQARQQLLELEPLVAAPQRAHHRPGHRRRRARGPGASGVQAWRG
jgi:LDH2 family malate/lactate/ureidoglycolate dehydrogenase